MAYATALTISTGNKVSLNYQSQEVSVTLTYQLEREDSDVLEVVRAKSAELAQAHHAAWQTLHDAKLASAGVAANSQTEAIEDFNAAEAATSDILTPEPVPTADGTGPTGSASVAAPLEPSPPVTPGQVTALQLLLNQADWSEEQCQAYLRTHFVCNSIRELAASQAAQWLLELQRALRIAAQQQRLEASLNGAHANANGSR